VLASRQYVSRGFTYNLERQIVSEPQELALKIRVRVSHPNGADAVCGKIARDIDGDAAGKATIGQTRLAGAGFAVPVISMERADGQPLGMEGEFTEYWHDTHCEGDDEESIAKGEARAAFMYGVQYGKSIS
jgi:hypothetical protein